MENFSPASQSNIFQDSVTEFDKQMMRRCLELAHRAKGRTSPNPMVGAVVVQGEEIVGEGFHPGAGQPHAEVFALGEAGERARGGTIYVSLEPCNHYGRTPPCSEAVIKAGVSKVVIGMADPHVLASGGIQKLRDAGIEVIVGVEEEACRQLNEAFIHRVLYQRPFGILKYAMTLDGKIATTTGHSAWITGENARRQVHGIRSECDAVIVGGNTVLQDNPHLTTHEAGDRNPLRVVMSRRLALPEDCHLWQTAQAPTLVFTQKGVKPEFQAVLRKKGVEVVELPSLSPRTVMQPLYERGLSSLLWECGGILAAKAIAEGTIQKVLAYVAPKIVGGETAPTPVADLGLAQMTEAWELERVTMKLVEPDFLIEGYLPQQLWA